MRIINDSSVWRNKNQFEVAMKKDAAIRIGMVREKKFNTTTNTTKYIVEVFNSGNQILVACDRLDSFGGVFNYEEYTHQELKVENREVSSESKYSVRSGDVVVVAFANGDSREGIILGSIKHPGRKEKLSPSDGIAYISEFNGVENKINKDGEYRVTFKGIPTNIADLQKPSSGNDAPTPTYNTSVGGSYSEFDKTGSWTLTDSAQSKPQTIKVDKPNGKISIISGDVTVVIDKNQQLIDINTKDMKIAATNSIKQNTKEFTLDASTFTKIRSPKVAIGANGVELLNELVKLITYLGTVVVVSPVGFCSPLNSSNTWPNVLKVQQAINQIKGSL